jgi:hypothetical protein
MAIAQELDIDYLGSDFQYFDSVQINEAKRHCLEPLHVGDLEYELSGMPKDFRPAPQSGRLSLWTNLDAWGDPPSDRDYVVGVDIAMGTGASNSAMTVADRRTGEKVAEFVSSKIKPEELALYAVALCQLFAGTTKTGAFLIWEANGPGRGFGSKVLDLGYRNIYWRRDEQRLMKNPTDIPGWFSTKEGRMTLLQEYRDALHRSDFMNRSRGALDETLAYVVTDAGVMHSKAKAGPDPTGARDNHADRVIADALASKAISLLTYKPKKIGYKPPTNSFWGRRETAAVEQKETNRWG